MPGRAGRIPCLRSNASRRSPNSCRALQFRSSLALFPCRLKMRSLASPTRNKSRTNVSMPPGAMCSTICTMPLVMCSVIWKSLSRGCSSGTDTRLRALQQIGERQLPRAAKRPKTTVSTQKCFIGLPPASPILGTPKRKYWTFALGMGAAIFISSAGARLIQTASHAQEIGAAAGPLPNGARHRRRP